MQTPEQNNKRPRDWKVAAVVAAASTLGLSSFALAGSNTPSIPEPIELSDSVSIQPPSTTTTSPAKIVPVKKTVDNNEKKAEKIRATQNQDDRNGLNSPFDDDRSDKDVLKPLPGDDSPGTQDSPDQPTPDEPTPDSPATPDEPTPDDPPTPDSPASADSVGSADGSADS